MTAMKKPVQQKEKHLFYISVGAKEAFYTLRKMIVTVTGESFDNYICNLSANKEDAVAKAQEYFNQISIRSAKTTPDIKLVLSLDPEFNTSENFKSRKVLNDDRIVQIENGITPIGSYRGFKITELPESHLLWLADQFTGLHTTANDRVFQTLASVALGLALERKLFDKKISSKSTICHLGEVGQRIEFKAEITAYDVTMSFYGNILNYTLLVGDKIIKYRGSKYIGSVGEYVNLKATIDEHITTDSNSEITFIKRPTII